MYVSGGYGYFPMAISSVANPTDHTSDETVYVLSAFWDSPLMRSGAM
jgi:hypothetical protein